jgi:hypothetical protein
MTEGTKGWLQGLLENMLNGVCIANRSEPAQRVGQCLSRNALADLRKVGGLH